MGRTIEEIIRERGHEVAYTLGKGEVTEETLAKADVAIEFSVPESAPGNIEKCINAGVPVVVGTTAWYDDYDRLAALAEEKGGLLFTATNFSIGVNLFFALNRYLARLMNDHSNYEASMTEIHHVHKLDSPSGTAITLAEGLIDELDRKNSWVCQEGDNPINASPLELKITSLREDEVPGTHSIKYESDIDEIEITHVAKGRKGFGLGAVVAAEWVKGKTGVYTMADLLGDLGSNH